MVSTGVWDMPGSLLHRGLSHKLDILTLTFLVCRQWFYAHQVHSLWSSTQSVLTKASCVCSDWPALGWPCACLSHHPSPCNTLLVFNSHDALFISPSEQEWSSPLLLRCQHGPHSLGWWCYPTRPQNPLVKDMASCPLHSKGNRGSLYDELNLGAHFDCLP